MSIQTRFTVYFEKPFWVGVFERCSEGHLEAAKILFGAEPKDCEIYEYFLSNWSRLRFSPPIADEAGPSKKVNPKRMQRAISAGLASRGTGTKALQALKLQQEQSAQARKTRNRENGELEKQLRFECRQKKKKDKHRGR